MTVAQAFRSLVFPAGLDLPRCKIGDALGILDANPNATFRQGQLVTMNSSGQVEKAAAGINILGVAKWTKDVSYGNSIIVDEQVVLPGTTVVNLQHGGIVGTSVTNNSIKVSLTAGGAALTVTVDYAVDSLTNGQIHRVGGAIPDGATVFVSYSYALSAADMSFQGENFWNKQDYVSVQGNKVAVVQNHALLFSIEYDSSRRYVVMDNLYCGKTDAEAQGLVTNDGGEGDFIGKCLQVPTAGDPYLGFEFRGQFTE